MPDRRVVLADATRASYLARLLLGVLLTVTAGSQRVLLTGLRQIGDLAHIHVGAGVIGAPLSVLALWA